MESVPGRSFDSVLGSIDYRQSKILHSYLSLGANIISSTRRAVSPDSRLKKLARCTTIFSISR